LATAYTNGLVKIYDMLSNEVRQLRVSDADGDVLSMCFARDNHALACGTSSGTTLVWELVTSKTRCILKGHRGAVRCVAFFKHGRNLATASDDTSVLLWDLKGWAFPGESRGRTAPDKNALWKSLGGLDAQMAYQSMWQLSEHSAEAITLIRENLKPVVKVSEEQVRALTKELDDSDYSKRDKANQALARLGEGSLPFLREALRIEPTQEQRRRVEALISEFTRLDNPTRLRASRALEVLEQIGGVQAETVLTEIASGMPAASLTKEAESALKRLKGMAASTEKNLKSK
jgi:hypothetical protein